MAQPHAITSASWCGFGSEHMLTRILAEILQKICSIIIYKHNIIEEIFLISFVSEKLPKPLQNYQKTTMSQASSRFGICDVTWRCHGHIGEWSSPPLGSHKFVMTRDVSESCVKLRVRTEMSGPKSCKALASTCRLCRSLAGCLEFRRSGQSRRVWNRAEKKLKKTRAS